MLLSGLGSVRIVKNCVLGLENAARGHRPTGHRPQATGHRPRSQFFPVRTSQPAKNIYIFSVMSSPNLFLTKLIQDLTGRVQTLGLFCPYCLDLFVNFERFSSFFAISQSNFSLLQRQSRLSHNGLSIEL